MNRPRNYKRGDAFSAKRMNDLVREAKSSREIRASGPGLVNEAMGNQVFNEKFSGMRLVVAIEDFEIPDFPTDFYDKIDKVPSAKCLMLRLDPEADYIEEQRSTPFRVWDPVAKINSSSYKAAGDSFWCVFNSDTKRWEVVSSPQGDMQIISFAVISTQPSNRSALVEIRQRTFVGQVLGSILDDSVVDVYDTDGCYLNEPNADLTGRLGKAALFYVDDEAAEVHFPGETYPPEKYWNVISLCCPSVICEAG